MASTTRRGFIKVSGAAVGTAALSAASYAAVQNANERVNVGIIGPGGMGSNHIRTLAKQKDVRITHVCDVDSQRLATAAKLAAQDGREPGAYSISDLRCLAARLEASEANDAGQAPSSSRA